MGGSSVLYQLFPPLNNFSHISSLDDRLQIPIVVDNVMVCKSAADTLTSNQSGDLHSLRIRFHEKGIGFLGINSLG